MAEDTILNLMVNHHALIETMFVSFKDEAKEGFPRAGVSLSELTWEMRKHFFVEESAIFDFVPLKSMDVFKTINHLKDEHIIMLDSLKKFSDDLAKITDGQINKFYDLLEDHRRTEEQDLYPRLDKQMRDEQKKHVLLRINEIPIRIKH